ncbi:MAG: N-acetyltransferase [Chloroflexi bacterium]|nr:MAG: N-acetyltransferase [Chloroflexota bacterium]
MSTENTAVKHNLESQRFEIQVDNHLAVLEYHLQDGAIVFTHTGVPSALEGRGIGSQLVRAGLEHARQKSLKVVPLCWFVAGYIQRHPEEVN